MNPTQPANITTTHTPNSAQGQVHFLCSSGKKPVLEIKEPSGPARHVPFVRAGPGRVPGEAHWLAEPSLPHAGDWQFRINCQDNSASDSDYHLTRLRTLWLQDGQIFSYRPAPAVSASQVIKIPDFRGSLPARALYIYLPRGYNEHADRFYPVLYMHDGQNCFEAFAEDSFAGSWKADETADLLIGQGRMRECIIVGVSNGQKARISEYLPPYVKHRPPIAAAAPTARRIGKHRRDIPIVGRADQTAAYYRYEVEGYLRQHYRILAGRDYRATCGSSMGGLFTIYLAWEHAEFARHHAALSPSFWMTRTPKGTMEAVERLRTGKPRDLRLWLDSGTVDAPGQGDDGMRETIAARKALLENGYVEGQNLLYYLDEGATHSEAAWAARLSLVFPFLFPIQGESGD